MLRSGDKLRFTATEVQRLDGLGIEVEHVRTKRDLGEALLPWLDGLAEVRPDLLEKMVRELAEAKGMKSPPRLSVVPSADSPGQ